MRFSLCSRGCTRNCKAADGGRGQPIANLGNIFAILTGLPRPGKATKLRCSIFIKQYQIISLASGLSISIDRLRVQDRFLLVQIKHTLRHRAQACCRLAEDD